LHQVGTSRHFSYTMHGHTYIKCIFLVHITRFYFNAGAKNITKLEKIMFV